jgi:hypothetical protein
MIAQDIKDMKQQRIALLEAMEVQQVVVVLRKRASLNHQFTVYCADIPL